MTLPENHPLVDGRTGASPLVRAFHGDRPSVPPVWFMRQAGRSLPEYRAAREGVAMLDACLDPALASEITLQPVRRHGVDAAIFFSDIVVPLRIAGVDVDIVSGVGPVFGTPARTRKDIDALIDGSHSLDASRLTPVTEGVARTVAALGNTPLIGFAGAPFTLAAYLVEGRPSRDHLGARRLMHADPGAWQALTTWVADLTGDFLRAQVVAGASAVQLFDSWAGSLTLADYVAHVAPASAQALRPALDLDVPTVHFGTGTGHLLAPMRDIGAGVISVDYRTPLDDADRLLGGRTPLQGNLDPALLAAPWPILADAVRDVVRRGSTAPAHVFNLGHGVPADTDPDVLTRVVELVRALRQP